MLHMLSSLSQQCFYTHHLASSCCSRLSLHGSRVLVLAHCMMKPAQASGVWGLVSHEAVVQMCPLASARAPFLRWMGCTRAHQWEATDIGEERDPRRVCQACGKTLEVYCQAFAPAFSNTGIQEAFFEVPWCDTPVCWITEL